MALSPYHFFLKHAGYSYNRATETKAQGRIRSAQRLARAEAWARAEDLEYRVMDDDERAYCYCDSQDCKYHEDSKEDWDTVWVALIRPCDQHGIECRHAETLASLSGIMDPSPEYLRVVKAELALEAMPDESPAVAVKRALDLSTL